MNSTSTAPQAGRSIGKPPVKAVVPLAAALNIDGFALGEPGDYIGQPIRVHLGFSNALGLSFNANGAKIISAATTPRTPTLSGPANYSAFAKVTMLLDPPLLVGGKSPKKIRGFTISNRAQSILALNTVGASAVHSGELACFYVSLPAQLQSPGPLQSMPTPVVSTPPASPAGTPSGRGWHNFYTKKTISGRLRRTRVPRSKRRRRRVTEEMPKATAKPAVQLTKQEISNLNKHPDATKCAGCGKEMPVIMGSMRACLKCEN